jgi:hypothetical protein
MELSNRNYRECGGQVAHTYNPSYLGGQDQKNHHSYLHRDRSHPPIHFKPYLDDL